MKKPVRGYVKLRRLARACEALKNTKERITDIALEYGFGSYEVFARAFKDAYGITPTVYRESDINLRNFDKPNLLLSHTMVETGEPLISDGLVLEINMRTLDKPVHFMGVQDYLSIGGHFPNGEVTGICNFGETWRRFGEMEYEIPGKPNGRKTGVVYRGDAPDGCFTYFVGVETEVLKAADGFKTWTMPATDYSVMGFEAESFEELTSTALNKAIKYGHMWERKKGIKKADFGAEIYYNDPKMERDSPYMEMWAPWMG